MARKTDRRRPSNGRAIDIRRDEFERLLAIIDVLRRDVDTQFKRSAQIQAELDQIKRAWTKMTLAP